MIKFDNFQTFSTERGGSMTLKEMKNLLWGRDNEIKYIEKDISSTPSQTSNNIHYFYGMSGVGKTRLFEYAEEYIKQRVDPVQSIEQVTLYFNYTFTGAPHETEESIVRKIYNKLRESGNFSFPKYELAHMYLFELTHDSAYRLDPIQNQTYDSVIDVLSNAGIETFISLLSPDPAITFIAQIVSSCAQKAASLFKRKKSQLQMAQEMEQHKIALQSFFNNLYHCSKDEIRGNLTRYLVEDINQSLNYLNSFSPDGDYHLLFLLDAFEKHRTSNHDWFVSKLIHNLQSSVWLIFGTSSEFCNELLLNIDKHLVEKFPYELLNEKLTLSNIDCEKDRKYIIEKSARLPAAVTILLQIYEKNGGFFDDKSEDMEYEDLFQIYFQRHLTVQQQNLFYCLSLFDSWDFNTFTSIYRIVFMENPIACHVLFDQITSDAALVEKTDTNSTPGPEYTIIDIARKALRKQIYSSVAAMQDSFYVKFKYESGVVDEIRKSICLSGLISSQNYRELVSHTTSAFDAAIKYYRGEKEFSVISAWCIETEQFMTTKGLFLLKKSLTELYLHEVQKKDEFQYDQNDNDAKRFRYRMMRDCIWAYRNLGEFSTAIKLAKQYCKNHIKTCGLNSPYTPYAMYQLGLTFQDTGNYLFARMLYVQTLELIGALKEGTVRPIHLPAIVNNVLGCLCMDVQEYKTAKIYFKSAIKFGNQQGLNGHSTWYNNLERLYFRWAQDLDREQPGHKAISKYIKKCKHYGKKARASWTTPFSVAQYCQKKSHKIILAIFNQSRSNSDSTEINWENYIRELKSLLDKLKDFQTKDEKQMALGLQNNLAVLYALAGRYDSAQRLFNSCLDAKCAFFGIVESKENLEKNALVINKPTIRDTMANIKTLQIHLNRKEDGFNRRDFILQI